MIKRYNGKNATAFLHIIVIIVLCILTAISGISYALPATADTDSVQGRFENSSVLDNLNGAVIGGKEFNIEDYPHNSDGKPQLISFIEFCYSYYAEKQDDYGLYVIVYNPQDKAFDTNTERNKIQLTYGGRESYSKYTLDFVKYSTDAGYEGRFFKFKVRLSESEKRLIFGLLSENKRIYKISGIELSYKNNVTEYACGQKYTYSGYAEGYGSELAETDTLSCTVDGFDRYLSLDVHSTYYRPKGTNGEAYERDTLHSVYFSVPNKIIEDYGEMTAVHATWLNALTSPALVTGNTDVYNKILPYVGKRVDGGNFTYERDDNSPVPYSIIASKYIESASWNNASYGVSFMSYNANRHYTNSAVNVDTLNYCFLADNGDADNYTLPAEMLVGDRAKNITGYFESYTAEHGGELVNGRFSKALFSEVANQITDINITKDEQFELTDEVISQNLWQKFVGGGYHVEDVNTYNVSAIKKVESSDFKATEAATCKGLFIDNSDYKEFKSYYDEATAKKETVYLFRYYQSSYTCYEAVEYKRSKGDWTILGTQFGYDFVDTNAYLMQMWVQLDFDIIDLTFTKDNVKTVIPVVMSPMDIAADGAPPVITTKNNLKWWQILLIIIAIIIIIILLIRFAPLILTLLIKLVVLIGKGLWWLIRAPFRLISLIVQKIKEKKDG